MPSNERDETKKGPVSGEWKNDWKRSTSVSEYYVLGHCVAPTHLPRDDKAIDVERTKTSRHYDPPMPVPTDLQYV